MSLYPKHLTLDLETTMKSPIGQKAHPAWPENYIVMWGATDGDLSECSGKMGNEEFNCLLENAVATHDLLVGQNIKFDLLYLLHNKYITPAELAHKKVWDTQLAEYLLSGQQAQYISLDSLALQYGGSLKDDVVKEFFAAGKGSDEIPESILQPYLASDVTNTDLIFCKQWDKMMAYNMIPLITSQMQALKATTLMEYHGMKVDSTYITSSIKSLTYQIAEAEERLYTIVKAFLCSTVAEDWDYSSNKDVSLYFFGGEYKYKVSEEVGVYKTTGKPKFKLLEHTITVAPQRDPNHVKAEKNKMGYYNVDEKVLKNLDCDVADLILSLRALKKQKTTYFEGMRDLTFPYDYIYPSLNHTSTKTGRLSCTKPNIQNQTTDGGIKKAYISRFGSKGRLVEFDYAQLEMVGLAYIANDEQLIDDINNEVDMHEALYKDMHGRLPTKAERKAFKPLSFGLVYGAGYKTLAENAGCTEKEAKTFIKVFYNRYKGVKRWHDEVQEEAKLCRKVSKEVDVETKNPIGKFVKSSPTGRRYVFREYYNDWKKDMSFSPTELKNYPVQGFATGDVVPFMVGVVSDALVKSDMADKAKFIMTVHDSMLFDVHEEILDMFIGRCYSILKNTTPLVNKMFNIDLPITLSVGCSVGINWQDMTERKMK